MSEFSFTFVIPANYHFVIPAKAGTQRNKRLCGIHWVPAFAGMTKGGGT